MDQLKTKDIQVLSRAYKSAKPLVKLTSLWRFLNTEYGIGCIDKNNLMLEHTDYQQIRGLIKNSMEIDISEPLLTGSRIDIAKTTGNEKFNAEAPGRHHLLLSSPSGKLLINDQLIPIIKGASYRVDWRVLDLNKIPPSIIVVENLQAFDFFQSFNLPESLSNALVVYRGHNISSKAVIDFLNKASPSTQIVSFCDYDPKGFEIALSTTNVTDILLPELEQAFAVTQGTRNTFEKQHSSIKHFSNHVLPSVLRPYWDELMRQKLCVSQENILAHSKCLLVLPLYS